MQLSLRKAQQIAQQNTVLKSKLRTAQQKIRALERKIERSQKIILSKTEVTLLGIIADSALEDSFAVDLVGKMDLGPTRLDYHLQRLIDGKYVELLFTDPALGENFAVTQKGRHALVKKHLI